MKKPFYFCIFFLAVFAIPIKYTKFIFQVKLIQVSLENEKMLRRTGRRKSKLKQDLRSIYPK